MQVQVTRGYQRADVTTADRLRIVVLCYEACIAHATVALEETRKGNAEAKGLHLSKACAIVSELMSSLDKERGGEVAERLDALYRYLLDSFLKANLKKDPAFIEGALRVLKELKEGWVSLEKNGCTH
ncbi:MAG: flagellar export chaperone FliS [bacterium]